MLLIVSRAARRAGLKAHPHALRRALATGLVRNGVGLRAVQELLGHANLATTSRYLGVTPDELRAVVDTLELGDAGG